MCQAIRELREEAKQIGREEGREEGRDEGKREGRQREKEDIIIRMLRKGTFTYEDIAELVNVSVEKVKAMGTQLEN